MEITARDKRRPLTVMTGWGEGRKVTLVDFAQGNRGLNIQNVGTSTSIISAVGGSGDAIIKMDDQQQYCHWLNLDPMPCKVLVVRDKEVESFNDVQENLDTLNIIADLGLKFLPNYRKKHKQLLASAKRLCKPNEFIWWHWCSKSATMIIGVE